MLLIWQLAIWLQRDASKVSEQSSEVALPSHHQLVLRVLHEKRHRAHNTLIKVYQTLRIDIDQNLFEIDNNRQHSNFHITDSVNDMNPKYYSI